MASSFFTLPSPFNCTQREPPLQLEFYTPEQESLLTHGDILRLSQEEADTMENTSNLGRKASIRMAGCPYEQGRKLGSGIFGDVFECTHRSTGMKYALKKMSKTNKMFQQEIFHREIRAGVSLKHPGIAELVDYFESANNAYLVYELVDGIDLIDWMTDRSFIALTEDKARSLIKQLIDALYYCHKAGVAHRDIKLDNIMLTKDTNTVKLVDFGLCSMKNSSRCTHYAGSPEYSAPEMRLADTYCGFKADVYSLGVVLFALVVGAWPFTKSDLEEMKMGKDILTERGLDFDGISKGAEHLLTGMLQFNPAKRFSLEQVMRHPWLQGSPHPPPSQPRARPASQPFAPVDWLCAAFKSLKA